MPVVISGAIVVWMVMSLFRFIVDGLFPEKDVNTGVVRILCVLIGIVGYVVQAWVSGPFNRETVWAAIQLGAWAGGAAILTYHAVTDNYFNQVKAARLAKKD